MMPDGDVRRFRYTGNVRRVAALGGPNSDLAASPGRWDSWALAIPRLGPGGRRAGGGGPQGFSGRVGGWSNGHRLGVFGVGRGGGLSPRRSDLKKDGGAEAYFTPSGPENFCGGGHSRLATAFALWGLADIFHGGEE